MMKLWEKLPKIYGPENWRAPPPAGYQEAQGWRLHAVDPWRPVGGRSCWGLCCSVAPAPARSEHSSLSTWQVCKRVRASLPTVSCCCSRFPSCRPATTTARYSCAS